MLGAGLTVSYGLTTGFERAAQAADLPDVLARFAEKEREEVGERLAALPNVEGYSYRTEYTGVPFHGGGEATGDGVIQAVRGERRGYAVVEGRDVGASAYETVIERGLAEAWGLDVGDRLNIYHEVDLEIVGIGVSPDNVAYPLAAGPRIYVSGPALEEEIPGPEQLGVNMALLWTTDPERTDITLREARATSYGLEDLRFVTRAGVRVAVAEAAGIVIALLVAFSLVALAAAAAMLATAAHADVQRRLDTIGIQRAVGLPRRAVTAGFALGGALVAAPAAAVGLAAGGLVAAAPGERLLQALNQLGPGWALVVPLGLMWLAIVALVALATAWPAWRATGRPIVGLLRGAEVTRPRVLGGRRRSGQPSEGGRRRGGARVGPFRLGVRLAFSRPARLGGTALVLAVSTGVVALMLALASLLVELRDDPAALGKRYEVAAILDPDRVDEVRELPGVADAAPRYEVQAANSFQLGATFRLIGFAGDHVPFEAPPLAEGRRLRAEAGGLPEAEIGVGTADALGLSVGSVLAAQLPDGGEVRFRVVGLVRALENSGRVAYVDPAPLRGSADEPQVAVKVAEGASPAAVQRALLDLGAEPLDVGAAAPDEASFLAVLAALLRAVAVVNGLVCLYTLMQTLALTARERRGTIAVLRATGAARGHVALLLGGVVAAAALPAVLAGLALERWVLGPLTADLAAGYANLELRAATVQALVVAIGVGLLAAATAWWVARRTTAEPVVLGLREE